MENTDVNLITVAYNLIKKYENDNFKVFLIEQTLPYIYICSDYPLTKDITHILYSHNISYNDNESVNDLYI